MGYSRPWGSRQGAPMFSKPQVKNSPPMMDRCASRPWVSKGLRPLRPGLEVKVRFCPRYSSRATSSALSAMAVKHRGPFFTSIVRMPAARPSSCRMERTKASCCIEPTRASVSVRFIGGPPGILRRVGGVPRGARRRLPRRTGGRSWVRARVRTAHHRSRRAGRGRARRAPPDGLVGGLRRAVQRAPPGCPPPMLPRCLSSADRAPEVHGSARQWRTDTQRADSVVPPTSSTRGGLGSAQTAV